MIKNVKKNLSNVKKTDKNISEKKSCQVSNNRLYDIRIYKVIF